MNIKGIIIIIMNIDEGRLDITKSESIIKFIRFKKEGKKVKKSKIKKKRVSNKYIEQQINKEECYYWFSGLIVFILIGIGNV